MGKAFVSLPVDKPMLRAELVPLAEDAARLQGQARRRVRGDRRAEEVFRDAGSLRRASSNGRRRIPDHYAYTEEDIGDLKEMAQRFDAIPVTTEKDLLRLSPSLRAGNQCASRRGAVRSRTPLQLVEQSIDTMSETIPTARITPSTETDQARDRVRDAGALCGASTRSF